MIEQIIFIESTLSHAEASNYVTKKTLLLSSIKRGDLIISLKNNKNLKRVVIVDGVFEQCPSITHKEIIWAIQSGIEVVGISSIGALRAVELRAYGMKGYGEIYNDYLTGAIDGDDEVALSFVNFDKNIYKTIPLVNLRKTILNLFDKPVFDSLIRELRKIHYRDRTWDNIKKVLDPITYNAIYNNYIDLKKGDVLKYLSKHNDLPKMVNQKSSMPAMNIYFNSLYVKCSFRNELDMIREGIINIQYDKYSDITTNGEQVTSGVLKILELDEKYQTALTFLLNQLNYFDYKNEHISQFLKKLIKENEIKYQTNLIDYFDQIGIQEEHIKPIFNGLLKLSKFFKFSINTTS